MYLKTTATPCCQPKITSQILPSAATENYLQKLPAAQNYIAALCNKGPALQFSVELVLSSWLMSNFGSSKKAVL